MWRQMTVDDWHRARQADLGDVVGTVETIIERVSRDGDKALRELALELDQVRMDAIRVDRDRIDEAYDELEPKILDALEDAADRINQFHQMQLPPETWTREMEPGIVLGVRTTPLFRVGAYIPGGRAKYPSTALMTVIPAKVAGVEEVIACSPPRIDPVTLVALDVAGVDEIYEIGGSQAIAAMALGTESVALVQKIVGPANVYGTVAKMLMRGTVEIDFPAGPSEIGVLADNTANPRFIAADILAQAEHDPKCPSVLVTDSEPLAMAIGTALDDMLAVATRRDVLDRSMANAGFILVKDIDEGLKVMNNIAPEHLSIQTSNAQSLLQRVRNAGSIFIGGYTPVACGDYASGTNHVLPTAGNAMMFSGLNVAHFTKTSTVQMITPEGLASIAETVMTLAEVEGLHSHSNSVRVRLEKEE